MKLVELKNERHYDRLSINRHSIRHYQDAVTGERFIIDRTTDVSPRFFELLTPTTATDFRYGIPPTIKVSGERYFGDGKSWKSAVGIAEQAIEKWYQDGA